MKPISLFTLKIFFFLLLTFRERIGVKKQSYFTQISRNPSTAVELKDVKSNEGVKLDD